MATSKKPRKKYDANAHLKQPIRAVEFLGNVIWLQEFKTKITNNTLTWDDFDKLLVLHRATFYDKYIRNSIDVTGIRGIIERVFNKCVVSQTHYHNGEPFGDLKAPLKIHHMQRKFLNAFIDHHIEARLSITDRREYTHMVYHGMMDHLLYCKMIEDTCPLNKFIDKESDKKILNDYKVNADRYKVKEVRSFA